MGEKKAVWRLLLFVKWGKGSPDGSLKGLLGMMSDDLGFLGMRDCIIKRYCLVWTCWYLKVVSHTAIFSYCPKILILNIIPLLLLFTLYAQMSLPITISNSGVKSFRL